MACVTDKHVLDSKNNIQIWFQHMYLLAIFLIHCFCLRLPCVKNCINQTWRSACFVLFLCFILQLKLFSYSSFSAEVTKNFIVSQKHHDFPIYVDSENIQQLKIMCVLILNKLLLRCLAKLGFLFLPLSFYFVLFHSWKVPMLIILNNSFVYVAKEIKCWE